LFTLISANKNKTYDNKTYNSTTKLAEYLTTFDTKLIDSVGRHQLKMAVEILTGHAPVRGHLQTMGLYSGDPSCRFCRYFWETDY
jgi:hypothetical protein